MNKNNSNKALIIANGVIKNPASMYKKITLEYEFNSEDTIIAADGGAANCLKMNLTPDIVIGDMDSIKNVVKVKLNLKSKNIKYISTTPEKDESDTLLAVEYAINLGVKKIIIAGAIGNRIDHSFANLILLSSPFPDDVDIKILTSSNEIFVVKNSCTVKGKIGKLISIFSLSPYTFFIKTRGLKYKLENEKLLFSPVRGLSNVFTEDIATMNIKEGQLLIIKEI
mgnify:CR=1 FL=1